MTSLVRVSQSLLKNARSHVRVRPSVRHHNFDGESFQRTEINMLSKEVSDVLYVEAYSTLGFRLNNGFRIMGPCVLFPRSILHWNVRSAADINEDSLSLFPLLEPKLDLLVLGIGDSGTKYNFNIIKYLRSKKLNVEILPTDQACATFNFLNSEGRYTAAAMIPPSSLNMPHDSDMAAQLQVERNKLFAFDDKPEPEQIENIIKKSKSEMGKRYPGLLGTENKKDPKEE